MSTDPVIPCSGAVVFDAFGAILLIRRGREPGAGQWSIPGGKCLPGELATTCCVRETFEETGLEVCIERHAGRVERPAPDGGTYVIDDFVCSLVGSDPTAARAADDAVDVGWFSRHELEALATVDGLVDTLGEWGLLPR